MFADIHILHASDFYQIADFKCLCDVCSITQPEYNTSFCLSFIRKGFFEYRVFNGNQEAHVGRVLISKPGYEHTTRHIDQQPDVTTVFEFKTDFFETLKEYYTDCSWFLKNNDIHSILLNCSVEADYIHHLILKRVQSKKAGSLHIDEMVISLLDAVISTLGNKHEVLSVSDNLKKYHLLTIETAQEFIHRSFSEDISLQQLAQHCHISPFHFSRIFKTVLNTSPHKYLLGVRLQHAKILIATSQKAISDIAFECGFSSLEYFATAYRQQFKVSPTQHRKELA
ncbi:MAG TPA: AraC family transcriptional regulator [Chitinophagaceae bacterium]